MLTLKDVLCMRSFTVNFCAFISAKISSECSGVCILTLYCCGAIRLL